MNTHITEIEVEGIGIMRPLNDWQMDRIRRIADRTNRGVAFPAFSLGMTVRQFKALDPDQQRAAWQAFHRLTSPYALATPTAPQRPPLPRPGEHVPLDKQIEMGRQLMQVKAKLPHGHFRLWVDEKSGISYPQAQRFMKAAKEAGYGHYGHTLIREAAE